mgnify:CR=1 FL=1
MGMPARLRRDADGPVLRLGLRFQFDYWGECADTPFPYAHFLGASRIASIAGAILLSGHSIIATIDIFGSLAFMKLDAIINDDTRGPSLRPACFRLD